MPFWKTSELNSILKPNLVFGSVSFIHTVLGTDIEGAL